VIRPLLATRNGIARLHRALVPPEVALLERSLGIIDTKALAVVGELGVADRLADGPQSPADLATACDADADALGRVLRYLVGRGVFRATRDGRFRNNKASALLRTDHDGSMRAWARFYGSTWHLEIWNQLEHSVRTGEGGTQAAFGRPFWDYVTSVEPAAGELFDAAMASTSKFQMEVIATRYDFVGRVCDVGGGTGTLLACILSANPDATGVLFDLPSVVAKAGPVLEAAGVAARVEIVGGSFFETVPAACDRYMLQAIVHDWDDESCVTVLTRCREAMAPGGRILVLEAVMPEHAGDHFAKALDLEMLVDTGAGRERTRAEFEALFARAGLRIMKTVPIAVSTLFELAPTPS
jgi:O-methyltransferase domain